MLTSNFALALKDIPVPDTTKSKDYVIKKHNDLLKDFNEKIHLLKGVKKGSLYGNLGMFYQAHEFFNAAKISYENAIELSKHDPRWPYLLAYLESLEGSMEKGNQLYKSVLNINSRYLPAYARWAQNELESGNFEQAIELFNKILNIQPSFAKALVGLGTISLQQGELDKAIGYFNQVLKTQPNASQVYYLISQAYSAKGEVKKANQYRKKQGKQQIVMFDKILQEMHLHSVSPSYYAQSALNAFMSQNYAYAEILVNKAILMDPKDINPKYTLLNIYLVTHKEKEARKLTYKLLKIYPNNERLYFVLGLTYGNQKNYNKAIEFYKKALLINPKNKTVNLNLAEVLLLSKKYNSALLKFKIAQDLDAENPYPIFKQALILSHLKRCHQAIPKYLQAIEKSPKNFNYLMAFVNATARCDGTDDKIRTDALNAARNMYNLSSTISVIITLASIELAQGYQKNAIDYQAQAIFQGLTNKIPTKDMIKLKSDYELIKKGIVPAWNI